MAMTPYFESDRLTVYLGSVLDDWPWPDGWFSTVVTSPPYWGLRDYGLEPEVWGGREDCEHEWGDEIKAEGHGGKTRWQHVAGKDRGAETIREANPDRWEKIGTGQFCLHCGAWRGQLGLEPTPELYVEHLVHVFRKVRRVLAPWGTVWLNIGDSYAGSWGNYGAREGNQRSRIAERYHRRAYENEENGYRGLSPTAAITKKKSNRRDRAEVPRTYLSGENLKPKDLCMIPARLALALQDDGWWVRAAPPWLKRNPMPESAGDRPTTAHEQIFLLTANAGKPLYWTHRDGLTSDGSPAPDYRWVHATGREQVEEPEGDWRTSIIACPVCGGDGWAEVPVGDMFGGRTVTVECASCKRAAAADEETEPRDDDGEYEGRGPRPGEVREWTRVNLWRGHDYFYDADAVRIPHKTENEMNKSSKWGNKKRETSKANVEDYREDTRCYNPAGRSRRTADWWFESLDLMVEEAEARARYLRGVRDNGGMLLDDGGNLPAALLVNTEPCAEAHFAVFPPALVEPMIRAGAPTKVCAECGRPWERVKERGLTEHDGETKSAYDTERSSAGRLALLRQAARERGGEYVNETKTLGFAPTCACGAGTEPARVFDPFAGTGTVAEVALKLGCRAVVLDAREKYCEMAVKRCADLVAQEGLF